MQVQITPSNYYQARIHYINNTRIGEADGRLAAGASAHIQSAFALFSRPPIEYSSGLITRGNGAKLKPENAVAAL
jgi:hypothetical protein